MPPQLGGNSLQGLLVVFPARKLGLGTLFSLYGGTNFYSQSSIGDLWSLSSQEALNFSFTSANFQPPAGPAWQLVLRRPAQWPPLSFTTAPTNSEM